jgi:hypothetical protein
MEALRRENRTVKNSTSAACSLELHSITFASVSYDNSRPSIVNTSTLSYYQLGAFLEELGTAGCPGGVTYALSPTGSSYDYYNGATWITSSTASQSTAASVITPTSLTAFNIMA